MKLLYDTGVTPLINKHYGYTFQPGRYGQVAMRAQPESRTRYPRQFTRMQHQAQTRRAWSGLSAGEISNWDTFAATYPQACKNPDSGYLTGYQNFLKRQYYQFLNYSPTEDIITNPGLTEIFIDPCTYEIRYTGGELFIDYEFTNWLNDNIVSLYCSYPKSPGRLYQKTQARYMGFIINENNPIINYGRLYNHYAVRDPRKMYPAGWHIPTDTEARTLSTYLGGILLAGGKMKETGFNHWQSPNTSATNSSGFTSRANGNRTTVFQDLKYLERIWTTTHSSGVYYWVFQTYFANGYLYHALANQYWGYSVRWIKDDSTDPNFVTGNDGTIYPTVKIGNQVWQALPCAETKYQNKDDISNVTDQTSWNNLTSGAWCAYNNDPSNIFSTPMPPLSLNITELYKYNFGLIPEPGKHLLFKAVPMAIENGQFFEKTLDLYAIV